MTTVEIVTIGDEIIIGEVVDTNSAWLGIELNKRGFTVIRITSVRDVEADMTAAIASALQHADIVLVTGGLGPTNDDKTTLVLSELFRSPLVTDSQTFEKVKQYLERKGIPFNENNQRQALVPQCATVIENKNGTAPAILFEREGKLLVAMPGVPFEMKAICTDTLFGLLENKFPQTNNVHISAITYGVPESVLAERIAPWENALPTNYHLAYLPNPSQVRLRLSVYDIQDRESVEKTIYDEFDKLKAILGTHFIGFEGESVEKQIATLLLERGATLSTAESCSGGNIAKRITALAGASHYFKGGIVAYDNSIKRDVLGVPAATIEKHGAVSREVVEAMADCAAKLFDTDYAVSTSGIAGPTGGTPDKPVGTVWIGIHTPEKTYSMLKFFGNLREQNIDYTTSNALFALLAKLVAHD